MPARADIGTASAIVAILTGAVPEPIYIENQAIPVPPIAAALDRDTAQLAMRSAIQLCRTVARENRRRRDSGDTGWEGIAYSLDPAAYGEDLSAALLHI